MPLCAAARYVAEIWAKLGVQGLVADDVLSTLKTWPGGAAAAGAAGGNSSATAPLLDALAAFRDEVRGAGRSGDKEAVLRLCRRAARGT